jgi:putative heme-binding domain-containing protein
MPASWPANSEGLYQSSDQRVRFLAEKLGAAFGDETLYVSKRRMLADPTANLEERKHAFTILAGAFNSESLPLLLELLDDKAFRSDVIPQLARFDDPSLGEALVQRFSLFSDKDSAAALNTLVSRESLAQVLLDAVTAERIDKANLTAYYVRQLVNLNSPAIDKRLARQWGKVGRSSAEKQQQIVALEKAYGEAPLWAYSLPEGGKHFQQLCANCHDDKDEAKNIGPKMAGSGSKGIRYFLENIIDPNAVIGSDYQMQLAETEDGRLISGIIEETTDSTVTMRTQTETIVVPRGEIESLTMTNQSLMPEGLLETLNERQQIELFKYLISL